MMATLFQAGLAVGATDAGVHQHDTFTYVKHCCCRKRCSQHRDETKGSEKSSASQMFR